MRLVSRTFARTLAGPHPDRKGFPMYLPLALSAEGIQEFVFDWYPIFGVVFMFMLLLIFMRLMRSTMGSTKPETVKASKGRRSASSPTRRGRTAT